MLREALVGGVSLVVSFFLAPVAMRLAPRLGMLRGMREDVPERHAGKTGTAVLGGVVILVAVLAGALLFAVWHGADARLWLGLGMLLAFGGIGLLEDIAKQRDPRQRGLKARWRMLMELAVAGGFVALAARLGLVTEWLHLPVAGFLIPVGWWYYPIATLFLVFVANAVNLSDGLDGLAGGLTVLAALSLAVVAYSWGIDAPAALAAALVGATAGFLWYNRYPARLFLGDAGALALGAGLGGIAVLSGAELVLVIAGLVFIVEAVSVMAQVTYFRMTGGRRIFRMTPLHHHFELGGADEPNIVRAFWLVGGVAAFAAVVAARLGLR